MRRLVYVIMLICFAEIADAQKFNYEIKIGGGLATQKINDPSVLKVDALRAFNAAFLVDYALPAHFALESGLCYMGKGGVIEQDAITTTPHINYLELPLLILKKLKLQNVGRFSVGAGVYHAIGISGYYEYQTPASENSLKFGNDYDVQKTDDGLRFLAGFELNNNLLFTLGYDIGLANIATQPSKDTGTNSIHNQLLYLNLGYSF